MATLAPRLLARATRLPTYRIVRVYQWRRITTATQTTSTAIPPEVVMASSTSPANPAATASAIVADSVAPTNASVKKSRAKSTNGKAAAAKSMTTKAAAARKTSPTKTVKSDFSTTSDTAAPAVKTRTRRTKAQIEADAATAAATESKTIAAAKTTRTRKTTKPKVPETAVPTSTLAAAVPPTTTPSSPTPLTPTELTASTTTAPVSPTPPPAPKAVPATVPIKKPVSSPKAAPAKPETVHNPDTGFTFSDSAQSGSESPAARQARGLAAAQHVAQGGKLPPRYKGAARRVTALIVALPFVIVGTPLVWERVVEGKERKVYPRPGPPAAGETVGSVEGDKAAEKTLEA
ncbi:hypothetical protein K461DRAFT_293536 [Myriangium duriaei CBS 260.36]|uniref:Uncharacterized protein n=1 Tax=Myriangium duriaei CBS 260.36 TaxID=1168546 RepID=A0A9P4J0J6_9PEZI|nr:hypothetical protein K461DRAFT_293536 [Myriangium duriaei CBS 260.36]